MEDKVKFFGQYLEQKVAKETEYPGSPIINTTVVLNWDLIKYYHLELKHPRKATNDEFLLYQKNTAVAAIDFLRSLGYAQPFMGYSIDDLVKLGWVKLI